uniref:Uncharacterized protein n=2 Tax=Guillardia theta TaxID=55529 RepID=A0A7S4K2Z8_GUITH|mmetsp:Transcript_20648/g.69064  ORF Transcript_20648/g.69064 Transcript_20648/m.69064 type:complete len:552 (+) Transcript_20648:364-2019(+)
MQQQEIEEVEERSAGQPVTNARNGEEDMEIRQDPCMKHDPGNPKRADVSERASRFTSTFVRKAASVGQKVDRGLMKAAFMFDKEADKIADLAKEKASTGFSSLSSKASSLKSVIGRKVKEVGKSTIITEAMQEVKSALEIEKVELETPAVAITLTTRQGFGLTSMALHKDSIYCTLESSSMVGKLGSFLRGASRNSKGEMTIWHEELDGKYMQRDINLGSELDGSFSSIAISGDGMFVLGDAKGSLWVLEQNIQHIESSSTAAELKLLHSSQYHTKRVSSLHWRGRTRTIVSAGQDGVLKLVKPTRPAGLGQLKVETLQELRTPNHSPIVRTAMHPDEQRVVALLSSGGVCLARLQNDSEVAEAGNVVAGGKLNLALDNAHAGGSCALDFSSAGDMLVTGGLDGSVAIWSFVGDEMDLLFRLRSDELEGMGSAVTSVSWCGSLCLAAGSGAGAIVIWDLSTALKASDANVIAEAIPVATGGNVLPPQVLSAHEDRVAVLLWDADKRALWSGSEREVKLWGPRFFGSLGEEEGRRGGEGNEMETILDNSGGF